jgi:hypothetical protein
VAVPKLRRLVAASHRSDPSSSPGQDIWDLWWTKWYWSGFSPSTLVSSAKFSFHRLLHTHHLSSGAGIIGQLVADVANGLSPTPL